MKREAHYLNLNSLRTDQLSRRVLQTSAAASTARERNTALQQAIADAQRETLTTPRISELLATPRTSLPPMINHHKDQLARLMRAQLPGWRDTLASAGQARLAALAEEAEAAKSTAALKTELLTDAASLSRQEAKLRADMELNEVLSQARDAEQAVLAKQAVHSASRSRPNPAAKSPPKNAPSPSTQTHPQATSSTPVETFTAPVSTTPARTEQPNPAHQISQSQQPTPVHTTSHRQEKIVSPLAVSPISSSDDPTSIPSPPVQIESSPQHTIARQQPQTVPSPPTVIQTPPSPQNPVNPPAENRVIPQQAMQVKSEKKPSPKPVAVPEPAGHQRKPEPVARHKPDPVPVDRPQQPEPQVQTQARSPPQIQSQRQPPSEPDPEPQPAKRPRSRSLTERLKAAARSFGRKPQKESEPPQQSPGQVSNKSKHSPGTTSGASRQPTPAHLDSPLTEGSTTATSSTSAGIAVRRKNAPTAAGLLGAPIVQDPPPATLSSSSSASASSSSKRKWFSRKSPERTTPEPAPPKPPTPEPLPDKSTIAGVNSSESEDDSSNTKGGAIVSKKPRNALALSGARVPMAAPKSGGLLAFPNSGPSSAALNAAFSSGSATSSLKPSMSSFASDSDDSDGPLTTATTRDPLSTSFTATSQDDDDDFEF